MTFIGLGKINKNLIPLALGCIFCFLNRIVNQSKETELFNNIILTNIFISAANLLIIIPYIISIFRSKKVGNNNTNNKNNNNNVQNNLSTGNISLEGSSLEYIYLDVKVKVEEIKYKKLFILLIAFIFFANYCMFVYTFKLKTNTWIMFILFVSIFYYLLFKSKLYRHHYLSIIIILILGIVIDIILGNYTTGENNYYLLITFSILRIILLSFNYVLIKYTIEKKYVSLYTIGFFSGILNLIFFIIFAILDSYFFHLNDYKRYFENFKSSELLIIFGLMFTQLGLYTTTFFIDKNESPCHIFIVFVFGQFAYYFQNFELPEGSGIVIVCLILILFFSLVFNEIIELNFFGLSFNTKKNIAFRAENELVATIRRESEESIESFDEMTELPNKVSDEYQ